MFATVIHSECKYLKIEGEGGKGKKREGGVGDRNAEYRLEGALVATFPIDTLSQ